MMKRIVGLFFVVMSVSGFLYAQTDTAVYY
jgi:hypothetical protein